LDLQKMIACSLGLENQCDLAGKPARYVFFHLASELHPDGAVFGRSEDERYLKPTCEFFRVGDNRGEGA
jgi:hypothetical protein